MLDTSQPIVSIDKYEIPSFEVLLRMIGQQDTLVPPIMFIPIAERLGLAKEIDYWVIKSSMGKLQALKMEKLRANGFGFIISEFGAGLSSFSYLKNMSVESVKIQGELVERITNDGVDCVLVKSMIDIAKACGKKVVAEYVCDQETYDLLKFYGIDCMQGFFVAMPLVSPFNVDLNSPFTENVAMIKQ